MEEPAPRRLRADAERNRRRLIEAATTALCERGLDVGVGEIADAAGVGRGTLFRHFPSKEQLVAAVVVDRMQESIANGRAQLDAPEAGEALFALLEQSIERLRVDRVLFEAVDDAWLSNEEIHAAHCEMVDVLGQLLARAQAAGDVRGDVGAVDVLMMVKGTCEAASAFPALDPAIGRRQLGLIWAALSPSAGAEHPLPGTPPTLQDLEAAKSCVAAKRSAAPAAAVVR